MTNKTKMPIASHNRSNHDLTSQHVTSSDFLQYNVSKCIEMVPNQKLTINHECFSRLNPLVVPTFGRASIQHRAFFVPMRTIFPAWNEFITDSPHVSSRSTAGSASPEIYASVPTVTNASFMNAFVDNDYSTVVDTEDKSDFTYLYYATATSTPTVVYRKFTSFGRFAYKLTRCLGYNPTFTNIDDDVYSALPLLAAARIFYDYYYPSQYANDENSTKLQILFTYDSSTFKLGATDLKRVFEILYHLPYPSDYFVSAWDTPTAPSVGHFSDIQMNDTTSTNIIGTPYTDTQEFAGTVEIYNSGISQFAVNALKALSDYMKRHQIVGSRALDRYLSRFGVKLQNEKLNRSVMVKEYSQDIQFADVMSTADTAGAELGSYAGKGLSYGAGQFEFSTDEYGYLFIVSTITPFVQYFQGQERKVKHLTKFDFYTPELDNLGTQALAAKELYVPIGTPSYDKTYKDKVFGFTPRYSEYKVPYSQLTGDLALNSFKTTSEPWTLYRDMSFIYKDAETNATSFDDVHHGVNFVLSTDARQYNRIFTYNGVESDAEQGNVDTRIDNFNVIHNFEIDSSFPGKSMYNDYNFENEDKSEKVTVDVGGTNVMN